MTVEDDCRWWQCGTGRVCEAPRRPVDAKPVLRPAGGGNFGDLWRHHTEFALRIVQAFPHNRIVALPQSVYYKNLQLARRDADAFAAHQNVTLLARTADSLALLDEVFNRTSHGLSPDAALMMGPVQPACQPSVDVVLLLRNDKERRDVDDDAAHQGALEALQARKASFEIWDWFDWGKFTKREGGLGLNQTLAEFRLRAANNLLCRGRVVVSNRLHAMLLSLLMGKPFVGFDNSYRKLSGYRSTFLDPNSHCQPRFTLSFFEPGIQDAVQTALQLLALDL